MREDLADGELYSWVSFHTFYTGKFLDKEIDGQHTAWVGASLLDSMGYAGEIEQYHTQEPKDIFLEAKDDDIPPWFEHKATEDSDTNDTNETT